MIKENEREPGTRHWHPRLEWFPEKKALWGPGLNNKKREREK